jgi:hypothetical protein
MQVCPELPMVSTRNRPLLVISRPSHQRHVLFSWYNADTNNEVMPNVKTPVSQMHFQQNPHAFST